MTAATATLIACFLLLMLVCVKPLGLYMAHVFGGRAIWALRLGAPLERGIYRLCGVDPAHESGWKAYAAALATSPPIPPSTPRSAS
jgi:potassium-transporting ATPase potassium-binding subunit